MLVKMKKCLAGPKFSAPENAVVNLSEKTAKEWIKAGIAEAFKGKARAVLHFDEEAPAETASKKTATAKTPSLFASPAAENFAAEKGIDPASIDGTGTDGKITKGDIEKFIEEFECLLGSDVQPAVFVLEDGTEIPLGEVVAAAHEKSGLSVEDWNKRAEEHPEENEKEIQSIVDALPLKKDDE